MSGSCPACAEDRLIRISTANRSYVNRCRGCGTASIAFDAVDDRRGQHDFAVGQENWDRYLASQNTTGLAERHSDALDRLSRLVPAGGRIFDVGAGAGVFLARASARGFHVSGNEIWPAAVQSCREQTGVDLTMGDDLFGLPGGSQDAATMWCVLAHADDPDELLTGIRHLLTRDGVLFFHTPRWCVIDVVALWLMRLTGYRRMIDRRISAMHRVLYSRDGLTRHLRRVGFDVIRSDAVSAFGLRFDVYLEQIGLPSRLAKFLGRCCDVLAERGLMPRNTLDVYALRSDASHRAVALMRERLDRSGEADQLAEQRAAVL